jgi:hypothetical protein
MTTLIMKLTPFSLDALRGETRMAGSVDYGRTTSSKDLSGQELRCTQGHLWVTLEGDPNDYVLSPGDRMRIQARGRVIIGGKGDYRLERIAPRAFAC